MSCLWPRDREVESGNLNFNIASDALENTVAARQRATSASEIGSAGKLRRICEGEAPCLPFRAGDARFPGGADLFARGGPDFFGSS